jgi:hypothetical protein
MCGDAEEGRCGGLRGLGRQCLFVMTWMLVVVGNGALLIVRLQDKRHAESFPTSSITLRDMPIDVNIGILIQDSLDTGVKLTCEYYDRPCASAPGIFGGTVFYAPTLGGVEIEWTYTGKGDMSDKRLRALFVAGDSVGAETDGGMYSFRSFDMQWGFWYQPIFTASVAEYAAPSWVMYATRPPGYQYWTWSARPAFKMSTIDPVLTTRLTLGGMSNADKYVSWNLLTPSVSAWDVAQSVACYVALSFIVVGFLFPVRAIAIAKSRREFVCDACCRPTTAERNERISLFPHE